MTRRRRAGWRQCWPKRGRATRPWRSTRRSIRRTAGWRRPICSPHRGARRFSRVQSGADHDEKTDQWDEAGRSGIAAQKLDEALKLYEESPYPVAWWTATGILEQQGHITETLPLYAPRWGERQLLCRRCGLPAGGARRRSWGIRRSRRRVRHCWTIWGSDWLDLRARKAAPNVEMAPPCRRGRPGDPGEGASPDGDRPGGPGAPRAGAGRRATRARRRKRWRWRRGCRRPATSAGRRGSLPTISGITRMRRHRGGS